MGSGGRTDSFFRKILTIRKIGNLAVLRDKPITTSDFLHTLKEIFLVLYWLARSYSPDADAIGKPPEERVLPGDR